MTSHEHPVFAAERKMNQCQHPKSVNPPSIRLLLVFLSERWSKPWPFMDNSALRPPTMTRGLPLSNVTGRFALQCLRRSLGLLDWRHQYRGVVSALFADWRY